MSSMICDCESKSDVAKFPELAFVIEGKDFAIQGKDYVLFNGPGMCIVTIKPNRHFPMAILGMAFIRNH